MNAKRTTAVAGLATAACAATTAGVAWHFAGRITEAPVEADPDPPCDQRVRVVGAGDDHVVLTGAGASLPGVWGLRWAEGYGQIQAPVAGRGEGAGSVADAPDIGRRGAEHATARVTRPFVPLRGGAPTPGEAVLDPFAYPPDASVLGLDWSQRHYPAPPGLTPLWEFPAERDTWVLLVHGRQARWHEGLRLVPALHRLGLPALLLAYRNDVDAPRSADGRSRLGATEWLDVEAAARDALRRGARHLLLVGFSMGGAIVARFLRASPLARRVRGAVLEAPVLDWMPVIRRAATDEGIPAAAARLFLPAAMALATARVGIDWRDLDQRGRRFVTPTLLIQGDADPIVPVAIADAVVAAQPANLTYERVAGAGHVTAWNRDPIRYEKVLTGWLDEVLTAAA